MVNSSRGDFRWLLTVRRVCLSWGNGDVVVQVQGGTLGQESILARYVWLGKS